MIHVFIYSFMCLKSFVGMWHSVKKGFLFLFSFPFSLKPHLPRLSTKNIYKQNSLQYKQQCEHSTNDKKANRNINICTCTKTFSYCFPFIVLLSVFQFVNFLAHSEKLKPAVFLGFFAKWYPFKDYKKCFLFSLKSFLCSWFLLLYFSLFFTLSRFKRTNETGIIFNVMNWLA